MKKRTIRVGHPQGLHTRPAVMLVKLASTFTSEVRLLNELIDVDVDAKSMMGLLMLEASHDTELILIVEGADEESAIEAIAGMIENNEVSELEEKGKKSKGLFGKLKSLMSEDDK